MRIARDDGTRDSPQAGVAGVLGVGRARIQRDSQFFVRGPLIVTLLWHAAFLLVVAVAGQVPRNLR